MGYPLERNIRYNNIGVTATDKFQEDTNEIVKKIEVRIDAILKTTKGLSCKVGGRIYDIERIYVREEDRLMEVSLSYAN